MGYSESETARQAYFAILEGNKSCPYKYDVFRAADIGRISPFTPLSLHARVSSCILRWRCYRSPGLTRPKPSPSQDPGRPLLSSG